MLLVANIERDYLLNEYETMKKTNGTKSFKDKINSNFMHKTGEVIVLNQNNNGHRDDGERIA